MSGCKIIARVPEESHLCGVIDFDRNRLIGEYTELLAEGDFEECVSSAAFDRMCSFAVCSTEEWGSSATLEYIGMVTQFCVMCARQVWSDYVAVYPEGAWADADSQAAGDLRMLFRTTCVTLCGMLSCSGIDAEVIEHNASPTFPYAVRVDGLVGNSRFQLRLCPSYEIAKCCQDWSLPTRLYYYADEDRKLDLQATDDIASVVRAVDGITATVSAFTPATGAVTDFNSTPCWRLVDKVGGRANLWEIRLFNNPIFGAYSAKGLWMPESNTGSVTLYRDFEQLCDVPVNEENYTDEESFKDAAWDAITGYLAVAVIAVQSHLESIMWLHPGTHK